MGIGGSIKVPWNETEFQYIQQTKIFELKYHFTVEN